MGGLSTNQGFLLHLANHPAFIAAELDTSFIPTHLQSLVASPQPDADILALAALAYHHTAIQSEALTRVRHECMSVWLPVYLIQILVY